MSHPLGDNLEVYSDQGANWVRCTRCSHVIARLEEHWRQRCERRTFSPTKAGPLMTILVGHYVLQKLYCPGCGTLLESDMVEKS